MIHMHIKDGFGNDIEVHGEDSLSIPRIGDRIKMGYRPAPTVKDIVWDFPHKRASYEVITVDVFVS